MNYHEGYKFQPQGAGMPPEPRRKNKMMGMLKLIIGITIGLSIFTMCSVAVVGSLASEAINDAIVDPTTSTSEQYMDDAGATKPTLTMTVSQTQAIESAQQYLDFSGFSKYGLMRQLTSDAGSGFTKADADFALKHVKVDWNAEAVESAQSYLDVTNFSRSGLIKQLTAKAGSGFTLKQATYAADKVGL